MNRVEYDKTGALTKLFAPQGSTYFQYAATGLVTELATPDKTFQFSYDGNLQRRAIVEDGAATYYIWDGLRLLETRNADHSLKAKFTHGVARIEGIGSCVEVYRASDGKKFYLPQDQRGTVGVVLDESRSVVAGQSCNAFGEVTASTGSWPDVVPFRYQSDWVYLCDLPGGTPLYLSWARIYHASSGCFTQRDFVHRLGGRVYSYARSAAPLRVDPWGFCSLDSVSGDVMMLYGSQHLPGETVEEFAKRLLHEQRRLREHYRAMRRSHPVRVSDALANALLRKAMKDPCNKGKDCSKAAKMIARAFYDRVRAKSWSVPQEAGMRLLKTFFGFWQNDIQWGRLCFDWANFTYQTMAEVIGKHDPEGCFKLLRTGNKGTLAGEVQHNYVGIGGPSANPENPQDHVTLDPHGRGLAEQGWYEGSDWHLYDTPMQSRRVDPSTGEVILENYSYRIPGP